MLNRSVAPPSNCINRPVLPNVDDVDVRGIPVTILNQGEQPVTLFELVIPIGRWQEPKPGLVFLLFKMITEGTNAKSANQIASVFDFFGSHLEIVPMLDNVSVKLYALSKFLPEVLPLLISLLTDSIFPPEEFNTLKQIRSQQIKQRLARNNVFADMKFREMIFGKQHPYGLMASPEDIINLQVEEVKDFRRALLAKPKIFVSGQVDRQVLATIADVLGGVAFTNPVASAKAELFPVEKKAVHRGESAQASIRVGKFVIDKRHPDIHRLKIANTLLGGFFGSRLMKNIREEKGLTYGIHSSLIHLEHYSYWSITSEVLKDKVALAKSEIVKEVDRLASEPPGTEEMISVKNYTRGKILSSFDSPFSSHEMIKDLKLSGLGMDYILGFLDTLDEITPEIVCKMTNKYLKAPYTELVVS